jgi:hypothetical protein
VVIDNTNGTAKGRKEYIALAQAKEVPVRCIYVTTPQEIANHLNYVRVVCWRQDREAHSSRKKPMVQFAGSLT